MSKNLVALFANPEFLSEFNAEIDYLLSQSVLLQIKRLNPEVVICELGKDINNYSFIWPQQVWTDVEEYSIVSIGDAAKKLKARQPKWQNVSQKLHRRATLIQESLRSFPQKKGVDFCDELFTDAVWSLVDKEVILCGKHRGPRNILRNYSFNEDKVNPPSRAYLKLWELFTRTAKAPQEGETVLELGASPGGWTWVMLESGCQVKAYDRSPLDQRLMQNPLVSFEKKDIFKVNPKDLASKGFRYDWVISDVIGETEKLCDLALNWHQSTIAKNLIFTIKFKGQTQMEPVYKLLEKVPNSQAIHLENNKHEITWYYFS